MAQAPADGERSGQGKAKENYLGGRARVCSVGERARRGFVRACSFGSRTAAAAMGVDSSGNVRRKL